MVNVPDSATDRLVWIQALTGSNRRDRSQDVVGMLLDVPPARRRQDDDGYAAFR
jgi:hypothetical protein